MAEIIGKELGIKTVKGKLLTVAEVANFLRVSTRWIETHMSSGTFPLNWYPVGTRARLVDSADLDDMLRKIRVSAGTLPLPPKSEKEILLDELTS
jgi:hypothetical protein